MEKEKIYVATIAADAEEVIEKYGFGKEEDMFIYPQNLDKKTLPEIKMPEKRFLHGPFNEVYPAAIDPAARTLSMARINRGYEIACNYGIEDMVLHSGYVPLIYFKEWHLKESVIFWKEFIKDKEDITVYIENVMDDEPYMMLELAEKIADKGIKLCLDMGHVNCVSSVPCEEWIKVLAPFLGHLHLHSNNGNKDEHLPLGKGTLNAEKAIEATEKYCRKDTTYTIESTRAEASILWLKERGFLK